MSTKLKTMKMIFYTPGAEMSESEPYVARMSYVTRAMRNLSHWLNILNATYTSALLEITNQGDISYVDYTDDVSIDYTSFDVESVLSDLSGGGGGALSLSNNNNNEICECTTLSGQKAVLRVISADGSAIEWSIGDNTYYNGFFCHAELVFGEYSYFIRWGSLVKKQRGKHYSRKGMVYRILDFQMERSRYNTILEYCEKCIEDEMGFNYLGIYTNFTLPSSLKYYLFTNGANYQCNNGTFCSEFIANALCHGKLFKRTNQTKAIGFNESATEDAEDSYTTISNLYTPIGGDDSLNHCSDITVNPSLTSPNDLYLLSIGLSQSCMKSNNLTRLMIYSGTLPTTFITTHHHGFPK